MIGTMLPNEAISASHAARRAIAQRFAEALDQSDFATALGCLAQDCRYEVMQETLIGPEAIIASYRESAEWGRRALEQVVYESNVEERDRDLSVLFTDRITHHGLTHIYRCRQHLTINDDGKIIRIVHEELPAEREKLDEFFKALGVER